MSAIQQIMLATGGGVTGGDPYFSYVVSLLHFDGTNGGTSFPDIISANTWTPNALTTSTAAAKFGTASGLFVRSSTSHLYLSATSSYNAGASDFTIETWINPVTIATTSTTNNFIVCKDDTSGGTRGWQLALWGAGGGKVLGTVFVGGTAYYVASSAAPSTGVWTHLAFVRQGQNIMLFVGGVLQGTTSLPSPSSVVGSSTYGVRLGTASPIASVYAFDGYIDDFRYTLGYARYTANFTPPAAAFPDY